jgi:polysaccharide deacetylase family protein (PEP-CTERM system associated)
VATETSPAAAPLVSFSVDVEDWYMGLEFPPERWGGFAPRLERGLLPLLDLLDEAGAKATFFILGLAARSRPEPVAEIAKRGHEVASHGWSHRKLYEITAAEFSDEIERTDALLLDLCGRKPVGFRAPFFSITSQSLWALDVLKDHGYLYDASIYPGANYRYGIPGSPAVVHRLDNGLVEFPVSTFPALGRRLGLGGAYLRILPLRVTERALDERSARGELSTIYVHPWELDPSHPFVRFRLRAMATHYYSLGSTTRKVRSLLRSQKPRPMLDLLQAHGWLAH